MRHHIYVASVLALFFISIPLPARSDGSVDAGLSSLAPSGTVQATFSTAEGSTAWLGHITGSYSGAGTVITGAYVFGTDGSGHVIGTEQLDPGAFIGLPAPFALDLPVPEPDATWIGMGFGIILKDSAGNTGEVTSTPFPLFRKDEVLIDHAASGLVVAAPNYVPGSIPSGIGISHTLINGLPLGNYYAVVFFDGLPGCPSSNYAISSFRAGAYWGYDTIGPSGPYSKAWSTSGGGCMQEFRVDPAKGGDWLWGALSNTGTAAAIADAEGVPAFAICATARACDPVTPHAGTASAHLPSSVLFLPGIKGSELFEENPLCLIPGDGCDIRLWLPLADIAAPLLNLDANGASMHDVYAKEGAVLSHAFGESFYDSFADRMEALGKNAGAPGWGWKSAAYDWRLSLPDITGHGRTDGSRIYFDRAEGMPYLERQLRSLASSSPSGKVTIVAHSNGGLVAKAILGMLGEAESARLIDRLVFVGVPQSGAPRALAALLFGDAESLPGTGRFPELLMSAAHARTFALTSPMAYHLLPSAAYFAGRIDPTHPLVQFGDGQLLARARAAFGPVIDTFEKLQRFALGADDARAVPAAGDVGHAAVLHPNLLSYAQEEHDAIDAWIPPPGIAVDEVAGVGVPTVSGIEFYEQPARAHGVATTSLLYRPLFTLDGDGTVPIVSALLMPEGGRVKHHIVDLRLGSERYSHANLLEMPEIEDIIGNGMQTEGAAAPLRLMASAQEPATQFAVFLHGEASLAVTDAEGRQSQVRGGAARMDIPGSAAGTLGNVRYVVMPGGDNYAVSISESASEELTLDLEELEGGAAVASTTFAGIAIGTRGMAAITVGSDLAHVSSLEVDTGGDGVAEFSVMPVLGGTSFVPSAAVGTGAVPQRAGSSRHIDSPRFPLALPEPEASITPVASALMRRAVTSEPGKGSASLGTEPEPTASLASVRPADMPAHTDEPLSWRQRLLRWALRLLAWIREAIAQPRA